MDSTHIERLQQSHFESIAASYQLHYGDAYSQQYRTRFIYEPMCTGIDLSSMRVLEAMCGDGQATEYLLSKSARVTGLDISAMQIEAFKTRWPQCEASCVSIFDTGLADASFDCVFIVGGLHHLHPRIDDALREIHRVLAPEGYLLFAEPHHGSVFDLVRSFWYRHDSLFAENEGSIDLNAIERDASPLFDIKKRVFLGNIAYLLVLNSMIFRVPIKLKSLYAPAAMKFEAMASRVQSQGTACFVVCQWKKK